MLLIHADLNICQSQKKREFIFFIPFHTFLSTDLWMGDDDYSPCDNCGGIFYCLVQYEINRNNENLCEQCFAKVQKEKTLIQCASVEFTYRLILAEYIGTTPLSPSVSLVDYVYHVYSIRLEEIVFFQFKSLPKWCHQIFIVAILKKEFNDQTDMPFPKSKLLDAKTFHTLKDFQESGVWVHECKGMHNQSLLYDEFVYFMENITANDDNHEWMSVKSIDLVTKQHPVLWTPSYRITWESTLFTLLVSYRFPKELIMCVLSYDTLGYITPTHQTYRDAKRKYDIAAQIYHIACDNFKTKEDALDQVLRPLYDDQKATREKNYDLLWREKLVKQVGGEQVASKQIENKKHKTKYTGFKRKCIEGPDESRRGDSDAEDYRRIAYKDYVPASDDEEQEEQEKQKEDEAEQDKAIDQKEQEHIIKKAKIT